MKIGYLGSGAWGFSLARILAENGHEVVIWTIEESVEKSYRETKRHPRFPDIEVKGNMRYTFDIEEAINGVDLVVESVTSKGLRQVLETIESKGGLEVPFVLTSKGIEQNTGLLLPEVAISVFGEGALNRVACLSGPTLAVEVLANLPASVVCSSRNKELMEIVAKAFTTPTFRVYPNDDIVGVGFGGAMKNIIAIASGISDGLGFGENTKAALMTRGLHEIRKLGKVKGALPETLNGLSGLGDLCATCISNKSRNYQFGYALAQGLTPDEAQKQIGMVVEGAYTCVSARQLGQKFGVALPITEGVYQVVYEGADPKQVVKSLLTRLIKEEKL
ncbi:MAG: NAD(P)H-dependent glycerol-3-phosphate dehydrogenase [Simkaniaceae bacterium]